MTSATLLARTSRARATMSVDWARLARLVLTLLALVPYVLGWAVGAVVTAVVWTWAAVVAGWRDGRRRGDPRE